LQESRRASSTRIKAFPKALGPEGMGMERGLLDLVRHSTSKKAPTEISVQNDGTRKKRQESESLTVPLLVVAASTCAPGSRSIRHECKVPSTRSIVRAHMARGFTHHGAHHLFPPVTFQSPEAKPATCVSDQR
jgi:hypothetical protein